MGGDLVGVDGQPWRRTRNALQLDSNAKYQRSNSLHKSYHYPQPPAGGVVYI